MLRCLSPPRDLPGPGCRRSPSRPRPGVLPATASRGPIPRTHPLLQARLADTHVRVVGGHWNTTESWTKPKTIPSCSPNFTTPPSRRNPRTRRVVKSPNGFTPVRFRGGHRNTTRQHTKPWGVASCSANFTTPYRMRNPTSDRVVKSPDGIRPGSSPGRAQEHDHSGRETQARSVVFR